MVSESKIVMGVNHDFRICADPRIPYPVPLVLHLPAVAYALGSPRLRLGRDLPNSEARRAGGLGDVGPSGSDVEIAIAAGVRWNIEGERRATVESAITIGDRRTQ